MSALPRTLIPLLLATCCLSLPARADDADKAAATALEGKGAKLERDLKTKDKPVIRANLAKTAITDDDLALVAKFEWLETLDLSDTPITDAGLAHLHGLKKLKQLDLTRTQHVRGADGPQGPAADAGDYPPVSLPGGDGEGAAGSGAQDPGPPVTLRRRVQARREGRREAGRACQLP